MQNKKFRVWVKRNEYPIWNAYIQEARDKFPRAFGGGLGRISDELGKQLDEHKKEYIEKHGDLFKPGKDISHMVYDGFVVMPNGGVNFPEGGWDINGENDETAVLMQYTGLKDKNGKEIYEGDIVKTHIGKDKRIKFLDTIEIVEFKNGAFIVSGFTIKEQWNELYKETNRIEVIGNIYENPELSTSK